MTSIAEQYNIEKIYLKKTTQDKLLLKRNANIISLIFIINFKNLFLHL